MADLLLNQAQERAYINLKKFLASKATRFLLLGPAGSGKTTVIVNAFNDSTDCIAFCSFTNKATQVLKKIADKFALNFKADFMTIHKLLSLEVKYLDTEHEIAFTFDKTKIEHMKNYKYIIFDECSTISADLYKYICEALEYIAFTHSIYIKAIFLGDYWQLPPVGEEKSITFELATKDRWVVSKLDKVMRSGNELMSSINQDMLDWIPHFKAKSEELDKFVTGYPYNLIDRSTKAYLTLVNFHDKFLQVWRNKTPDVVILTYSRTNCIKTNHEIQDRIDVEAGREIPEKRDKIIFNVGDRCCLDKPIDLYKIITRKARGTKINPVGEYSIADIQAIASASGSSVDDIKTQIASKEANIQSSRQSSKLDWFLSQSADVVPSDVVQEIGLFDIPDENPTPEESDPTFDAKRRTVILDTGLGETLFNGEIFDIIDVEPVYTYTPINRLSYLPKLFEAQLLTIRRVNDISNTYQILHIDETIVNDARKKMKNRERRMFYLNMMSDFIKRYPKLDYGYCMTIYKSQGSEWDTVFVNLNSIKWSIIGRSNTADIKKKIQLFKTTYTAASRAQKQLYCFWSR